MGKTVIIPYSPHQWAKAYHQSKARFRVLNWHRRARKTTAGLNDLLRDALTTPDVYRYIAPTYRQAKQIVWEDREMLSRYVPTVAVEQKNDSSMMYRLRNGSMLAIHGCDDPDALRGLAARKGVFDEYGIIAARHGPRVWEEIVRPMIAANNGRWDFLGTPKGRNHFWELSEFAQTDEGRAAGWWYSKLPATLSGIVPPGEIETIRRSMSQRAFEQEFLCEFLSDGGSVFRGVEAVATATKREPVPGHRYVVGADLARTTDFCVLVVVDRITLEAVYWDRWQERSWEVAKTRIVETAKRYNEALIRVDATGVGDPIEEDIRRMYGVGEVEGFKFTQTSKAQIVDHLAALIEAKKPRIPDDPVFLGEMRVFTQESSRTGTPSYGAPSGMHDDCVIALCLAFWGLYAPELIDAGSAVNWEPDNYGL